MAESAAILDCAAFHIATTVKILPMAGVCVAQSVAAIVVSLCANYLVRFCIRFK
jgi:hypothetical protein